METTESPTALETASGANSQPPQTTNQDPFDDPLILIDAKAPGLGLDLRELWAYRELLFFLAWRDISIRYKQTFLGAAWAVIQPLFTMLLFTLLFGRLARMPSDGVPYPVFAYAALLPWTFFANAVTNSGNSLIGSSSLITKVYFPRIFIPAAAVLASLLDLAIASLLLVPMLFYYQATITWRILLLPLFASLATVLALAVGMCLSALNVQYRDVRYALPFLIQLWLFASPVIYPVSIVPEKWRWLLALNPMTGVIEGFRSCLFGRNFDAAIILPSVLVTLALLAFSFFAFRRVEDSFADVV